MLTCSILRSSAIFSVLVFPAFHKPADASLKQRRFAGFAFFRKSIYTSLYPERLSDDPVRNWKYIPKTLFFAKTDSHADNITEAIKKSFAVEFEKAGQKLPEKFVQKITCKAGNSNQLIQDFRNEKEFRIAVTVTLVATGTDVKPLEILVFMRDINSAVLYTQMKGRGCRTMDDDKFQLLMKEG